MGVNEGLLAIREALGGVRQSTEHLAALVDKQETRSASQSTLITKLGKDIQQLKTDVQKIERDLVGLEDLKFQVKKLTETLEEEEQAKLRQQSSERHRLVAEREDKIANSTINVNAAKTKLYLALAAVVGGGLSLLIAKLTALL